MGCTQGGRLSNSFIYPNNENMSLEMLMRIISNSELDKLQSNTYLLVMDKNCYQIIFVLCKYLDKKVFWYTYNIYSVICAQYHTGYVVYTYICCSVVGFFFRVGICGCPRAVTIQHSMSTFYALSKIAAVSALATELLTFLIQQHSTGIR